MTWVRFGELSSKEFVRYVRKILSPSAGLTSIAQTKILPVMKSAFAVLNGEAESKSGASMSAESTAFANGNASGPLTPLSCLPSQLLDDLSWMFGAEQNCTSDALTDFFGNGQKLARKWQPVLSGTSLGQAATASSFKFTVCSYNVLCQTTIGQTMYLYPHCKHQPDILSWNFRCRNLFREFWLLNADIFCLQEVQADHFHEFYEPFFERLGYRGVFKQRTLDKVDGCATFFRVLKFRLCQSRPVEYLVNGTLLDRDNVALIVVLEPICNWASPTASSNASPNRIVVANTHLLFNPKRGDVKLAQLVMCLAELDKISHAGNTESGEIKYLPSVLCGDFNAVPYSPLYHLLTAGELQYRGLPSHSIANWNNQSGHGLPSELVPRQTHITDSCVFADEFDRRPPSKRFKPDRFNSGLLQTPLRLVSVHNHVKEPQMEKEVTTYHRLDANTLDYIFYGVHSRKVVWDEAAQHMRVVNVEEDRLKLRRRYSLVTEAELRRTCGFLPNEHSSSDHLPLLAEFELT